jgi:predicted dinucleotide-binding enzyme
MPAWTRRAILLGSAALLTAGQALAQTKPRIGIIGAGNIGGALGKLWAEAGYPVMLSARDLGPVKALAAQIGHGIQTGSPAEAVAFGAVIVVSVPWGAVAQVGRDYGAGMKGKVVIDTCNPSARRDGPDVAAALEKGAGLTDQAALPGTRLVRAFNSIQAGQLASQAHRPGE